MVSGPLPFINRPVPSFARPPGQTIVWEASGALIGVLFFLAIGAALFPRVRKKRPLPTVLGHPDIEAGDEGAIEMQNMDIPKSATLQGTASTNKGSRNQHAQVTQTTAPYSPTALDNRPQIQDDMILPSPISPPYTPMTPTPRPQNRNTSSPIPTSAPTLPYASTSTDIRLTNPDTTLDPPQSPRQGILTRRGDGRRTPTLAVNNTGAHATGCSTSLAVRQSTATELGLPPESETTRNLGYGEMPLDGESRLDFLGESGISGRGSIEWEW